ncbi:hypothetical protein [Rhizobium sp. NXC24]|uniref:hypothetical protein n=1 Tax=Rhizobium sp. NXC24 TaxID=2048897 RepID=UPI000CF2CD77|nr:hypothetical protein [Rhizobium sp. NXC24]
MEDAFYQTIVHPISKDLPELSFRKVDASWSSERVATARRLIAAYKAAMNQESSIKTITDEDLWSVLIRENLGDLLDLIQRDDAEQLSHYLANFGREYTWFGGITTGVDGYTHWDRDDDTVAYGYYDKLICLAEALAVLPIENPEAGAQGNWGKNALLGPFEITRKIEEKLGIVIVPPTGCTFVAGLDVGSGPLHYRHINSLYLANRIRELSLPGDRICEFGGGLGIGAYYLNRMGWKSVTIFDLPIVNLLAGHFLINALGDEAVCLEGENERNDAIRLRANWNCVGEEDGAFSLTANQDSFPEINRRMLDIYVKEIGRTTQGYFLSINHETFAHAKVSTILSDNPGFQSVYRSPYWLRRGYVEELFRIAPVPHVRASFSFMNKFRGRRRVR